MGTFELLAIAVGLAMDAFAVAIGKGLCIRVMDNKNALTIGLFFGGFQAFMPLIGYFLGIQFEDYLTSVDHWIIFSLLSLIGVNMILESHREEKEKCDTLSIKNITILALATSIDALAIGITFAFLHADIYVGITVIGIITFLLSFAGAKIGSLFGMRFKSKAEIAGGLILILIGMKILLEHLGYLSFEGFFY